MKKCEINKNIHTLALESCLKLNRMLENSPIEELLSQALEESVRLTKSKVGFLHFIDPVSKMVEQHLWTKENNEQRPSVSRRHYPIDEVDDWTDCLETGEPVIHNHCPSESRRKGLPNGHPPLLRQLLAPLKDQHKLMAVMGVGDKETNYDPEDIQTLMLLAENTWNIIRRKRAEDALKRSESHYRSVVENLPVRLFMKDRKSVYISSNSQYAHDVGIRQEEIAGKTDFDFYPREIAEQYRADDRRIMRNGATEEITEKYANKNNTGWAHTIKTPIRDEQGHIRGIMGIFWDVTGRKQAEEKLEQSLNEKTILMKEIHHRVRNNLQLIVSLLHWQADAISSPEAKEAILQTIHRIFSIAMVHDKLYQSQDLSKINFKEYVEYMVRWLLDSIPETNRLHLHLKIENILIGVDLAIPCGLILGELLPHAVHQALTAPRPSVRILFHTLPDQTLELIIHDNGPVLSFNPTPPSAQQTLSMQLVDTLTQQIQGALVMKQDNGSLISLRFRAHEPTSVKVSQYP